MLWVVGERGKNRKDGRGTLKEHRERTAEKKKRSSFSRRTKGDRKRKKSGAEAGG